MRRYVLISSLVWLALRLVVPAWGQPVNVLTQHNDNNRSGANLKETVLNTSNVNPVQFGRLFSRAVDGQVYAQPLFVPNLTIPGRGTHNVVFVTTQRNSVYAFDADDPNESAPLWKASLGASIIVPNDECCNRYGPYHDLFPDLGITGTPVIDPNTQTLYVVSYNKEFNSYYQRLHALDITTGEEKFGGPVNIRGSVPGNGYDQVGGRIIFEPVQHLQRPGLLLMGGVVFIAFASHADTDPYHGWVFAYDATTLAQLGIYCTTPNGSEGGIWQSGQGLVGDSEGNVYFMTGNGSFDTDRTTRRVQNYGDSFVKLSFSREGGLTVRDWFTPCNQCCLDRADADLGSAGPMILPGTRLLLGGGKQGVLYLLNVDSMGYFKAGQIANNCPQADCDRCVDDQILQRFRATSGSIHGAPVFWDGPDGPTIYIMGGYDRMNAFRMVDGLFDATMPVSRSNVGSAFAGGSLSLSADGRTPGSGIVWTVTSDGNSNPITLTGVLRAFDASDLTNELWNSRRNPAFDDIGNALKFNSVTVANGKVYVPTFSGQLHVYGLLPPDPPPLVTITAPTPRTTFTTPVNTTLRADALSRDNSVTQVDFYDGGVLIGSAPTPPYSIAWNNASVGRHTLTAVAGDTHGNAATSAPVEVTVLAGERMIDRIISINFVGGGPGRPDFMEPDEAAGVIPRSIWNNAPNRGMRPSDFNTGWLNTLFDDAGLPTGARLAWSANGVYRTPIDDIPGDYRMMKGYLDTSNTSTTNVTVSDLPESFTVNGYDVYVYFDGDNAGAARTAIFRSGAILITGTDAAGANFSGKFTEAIAGSAGNYVVFPGLTDDRFYLEATPGSSTDSTRRAPINGIQIVAHAAP